MKKSFANHSFAKKLKEADDLEHRYYQLMRRYFPMPNFEDLVIRGLSKEFGKKKTWDLLPFIASDFQDEDELGYPDDAEGTDMDAPFPEDAPWNDAPPPDAELLKQEEKFKELCNSAGAYSASVSISLCNICGLVSPEISQQQVLSCINLAARAQMNANNAITALFPNMNFVSAAVYADKATQLLGCVDDILTLIGEQQPARKIAISPLKQTVQKALEANQKLAAESSAMGDNPNTPF